jgi:hypothetical protein
MIFSALLCRNSYRMFSVIKFFRVKGDTFYEASFFIASTKQKTSRLSVKQLLTVESEILHVELFFFLVARGTALSVTLFKDLLCLRNFISLQANRGQLPLRPFKAHSLIACMSSLSEF